MAGFHALTDLSHDPKLAEALGNMVIAWAYAEESLIGALSRISGMSLNKAQAGFYRIPTFESRIKFIRALITEWNTKEFNTAAIDTAIDKLSHLSSARNHWVHGCWLATDDYSELYVFDMRADAESDARRKPVKAADVRNHNQAVLLRADALRALIDMSSLEIRH